MSEELSLQGIKSAYDYVLDKDLKGGTAVDVQYEKDCIIFKVDSCSAEFADKVILPELKTYLPTCLVDAAKVDEEQEMGVCISVRPPEGWVYKNIAEDSFLEDLRQTLGPELAYKLSIGVAKAALEAGSAEG